MPPWDADYLHQYWVLCRIRECSRTGASFPRAATFPEFRFWVLLGVKSCIYRHNMQGHFRGHGRPAPLPAPLPPPPSFQPLPMSVLVPSPVVVARPRLSRPERPPPAPISTRPCSAGPCALAPIPWSLGRSPAADACRRPHPASRRVCGAVGAEGAGGRGRMIAESPIFVSNLCVISADRGGNPDLQLPQRPCTRGFAMQQSNSADGR